MNKKELFDSIALKIEPVKLGNKTIYVRELTGLEMAEYEGKCKLDNDSIKTQLSDMALFCTYVVCNKNGKSILTPADAAELEKRSFSFIEKASTAGMKVNRLSSDEVDKITKK